MRKLLGLMKKRKIWLVMGAICAICIISFAIYLYLVSSFFSTLSSREVKMEGFIKTDLGDEFYIVHEVTNFPRIRSHIKVYHKDLITQFSRRGDDYVLEISTLLDNQDIRCYLLLDELIYRKKGEDTFKAVSMRFDDPNRVPELIPIAKKMIKNNEWRWAKVFAEFLIKAQDQDIVRVLNRYAKGEFTDEEISINKDSGVSKREMQEFSMELLHRYGFF